MYLEYWLRLKEIWRGDTMDDKKNKVLFRILQEDCEWKDKFKIGGNEVEVCRASDLACKQNLCMPFKFAVFFNRPEVKDG